MSSSMGPFDVSIQVSDLDEDPSPANISSRYSFLRRTLFPHRILAENSFEKRSSIASDRLTRTSSVAIHRSSIADSRHSQSTDNVSQFCAMIIGSTRFRSMIRSPYELFRLLLFTFDSSTTVDQFLQCLFVRTETRPRIAVLYRHQHLNREEPLISHSFQCNLIVYVLLIGNDSPPIVDLPFSPALFIRVSADDGIARIHSLHDLSEDTTIKMIKERLLDTLDSSRMFYYGFELTDDLRPLSSFLDLTKSPRIFDLVLHRCAHSSIHPLAHCSYDDDSDVVEIAMNNTSNLFESDSEIFFRNFALISYIRLRIEVTLRSNELDVLSKFYSSCEGQPLKGIFVFFAYLNDDHPETRLTSADVLPMAETKEQFRTSIIDILTEQIRLETFQSPEYAQLKCSLVHLTERVDQLVQRLENILGKDLPDSIESDRSDHFFDGRYLIHSILFIVQLVSLPVTLFIHLTDRRWFLRLFACLFAASIVYFILSNVILFHYFSAPVSTSKINAFEVYVPLALILYLVAIFHLCFLDRNFLKESRKYQRAIRRAEINMLQYQVNVNLTVVKYESREYPIWKFTCRKETIVRIGMGVVAVALATLQTCLPVIVRHHAHNEHKPWQIDLVQISSYLFVFTLSTLFLLISIDAFHKYDTLYAQIQQVLRMASMHPERLRLNLKDPHHGDLLLALIREKVQITRTIPYRIASLTMIVAALYGIILTIVSIVRVFHMDMQIVTSVLPLVDLTVLFSLVTSFRLGIRRMNRTIKKELANLVLRTKQNALPGVHHDNLDRISDTLTVHRESYMITLFADTAIDRTVFTSLTIFMFVGLISAVLSFLPS